MDIEQFRSALRTRPFRAFTVRTAGGESYEVAHPETVGITPSGQTVVLAQVAGVAILDTGSITEYVVAQPGKSRKSSKP
jgi:hypothetical protein